MVWMECTACRARADTLGAATLRGTTTDEPSSRRSACWWICLECDRFAEARPLSRSRFRTMVAALTSVLEEFAPPPAAAAGRGQPNYPALPGQTLAAIWWVC